MYFEKKQKKEFWIVRNCIKKTISLIDFAHLSCFFLVSNDSKLVKIKQVHYEKLYVLEKNISTGTHHSEVIFDYSSYKLSNVEKNVPVRGLHYNQ